MKVRKLKRESGGQMGDRQRDYDMLVTNFKLLSPNSYVNTEENYDKSCIRHITAKLICSMYMHA